MPAQPKALVEPIRRSINVSWPQAEAYRRFTADFAEWWPSYSNSIGGPRVKRIVFDCRVGGSIYEEHKDGTRFLWGTVIAVEAPRRVAFTFHATHEPADAQQIEVTFTAEGGGTRVELVSTGWEKMGDAARRARSGYRLTWGAALATYAGRFSGALLFFRAMAVAIDLTRQRGSFVRGSQGRMNP
jgi:uncharacterized protein YndB with AHSA1/START domain